MAAVTLPHRKRTIRPSCAPTNTQRAKKSDSVTECLDRSRGGVNTKIQTCTDALGNAVRLLATSPNGEWPASPLPLLAGLQPGQFLADTTYDSAEARTWFVPSIASRPLLPVAPTG